MVFSIPAALMLPVFAVTVLLPAADNQKMGEDLTSASPSQLYPSVGFQVLKVGHMLLSRTGLEQTTNASVRVKKQSFVVTGVGLGTGPLRAAVNASYGPLSVDAPIPEQLLLGEGGIWAMLLSHQVRSSAPVLRVLFHVPSGAGSGAGARGDGVANCVTAYAYWQTQEVRGACLVAAGGFCLAQMKPEPAWFGPAGRSGSSSKERGRGGGGGLQGNSVEVYFRSRTDPSGVCLPQDSLRRVGPGRGALLSGLETPMRRIGSVNLLRTPPGNPTFLRLRLGGSLVVQTSSKPLKMSDVATFYVFLSSSSPLEGFTLRASAKRSLTFRAVRPSDPSLWSVTLSDPAPAAPGSVSVTCQRKRTLAAKRGLLEVFQLDFVPRDVWDRADSQMVSWHLELPGNQKDVGLMKIFTTHRDFVGLAPMVTSRDVLNTAVLTGERVALPVRVLAVEANGSVSDVTSSSTCRSTDDEALKVSENCDYVFVNGKESRGRSQVRVNFTYSFLSAQLEISVWMPRLPLIIDLSDSELSQIKGWRVPVTTGNRRSTWESEEDEEMRKGRGCMLQYQHAVVRVLTPFTAQTSAPPAAPDPGSGESPVEYFLTPEWQMDVSSLVRPYLKVLDTDVAILQGGVLLQGRAMGTTTLQVLSPLSSSVLAERSVRVLEEKVSVTELGVQLVSGLSLSLQLSPGSNRAIVATATTQEVITQLKQEAMVSCWVRCSDGSVSPLDLFERASYSLSVTTADQAVVGVRRSPNATYVAVRGPGAEGPSALVRAELRIGEGCQKSKRRSRLALGSTTLKVELRRDDRGAWATTQSALTDSEGGDGWSPYSTLTPISTLTATTARAQPPDIGIGTTPGRTGTSTGTSTTTTTTTTTSLYPTSPSTETPTPQTPRITASPGVEPPMEAAVAEGDGQRRSYGNMLDGPVLSPNQNGAPHPQAEPTPPKEMPRPRAPPRGLENDIIRTFKAMSEMEIGMFALVGVSCVALLAFLVNCASYNLCLRSHKTPIQAGPPPPGDHKHDWVWLGAAAAHAGQIPGPLPAAPTLQGEAQCPSLEPRYQGVAPQARVLNSSSSPPQRTATLGRYRASSQQQIQYRAPSDTLPGRSATLLARPHRDETLHSPTSKRNQVQFTTFTTLDVKHLAALRKNGVDLHWAHQQQQQMRAQQGPLDPPSGVADMPWPVVTPGGQLQ